MVIPLGLKDPQSLPFTVATVFLANHQKSTRNRCNKEANYIDLVHIRTWQYL